VAKIITVALCSVTVLAILFAVKVTARAGYESAEYTVVEKDGNIEIREYPDLMLAMTEANRDAQGSDGSFMRLFRYISGSNKPEQKIAMTTPVFMQPKEKDASQAGGETMGFVLPKAVAQQQIPTPTDDAVNIRKRSGGRFAVIRFAGRMSSKAVREAETRLRTWVAKRGLTVVGEPETAGYDPPWTPGPLRRNEVLLRLANSEQ